MHRCEPVRLPVLFMVAEAPQIIIPKTNPVEDRGFWETLERNIRLGIGKEKVLMEQQMRENARLEQMIGRKTVDGLGQLKAIIPARLYFRWAQMEQGFWNDRKGVNKFLDQNPELKAARPESRKYY